MDYINEIFLSEIKVENLTKKRLKTAKRILFSDAVVLNT